jgi:hypothetical protein
MQNTSKFSPPIFITDYLTESYDNLNTHTHVMSKVEHCEIF